MIGLPEKLAAVERLIEEFRWARNDPLNAEHATFITLKAIAADLRAQEPEAKSTALRELERRIEAVNNAKAHGYIGGAMIGVGEELIGRWPVVRLALERFEKEAAE